MGAIINNTKTNLVFFVILSLILCYIYLEYSNFKNNTIYSDGKCYYAYLPAIFIYHDLQFNFIDEYESKYYNKNEYSDFRRPIKDNKVVNIGYVGTAILWIPFFLFAHLISSISGFPTDGYSFIYQIAINVAGLFYLLLGLWYFKKFLEFYSKSIFSILFILLIVVFATPLYYYAVIDSSFTHVYSFSMVCIFLFTVKKFFISEQQRYIIYSAILLALIALIRPTNIIIIFAVPFLSSSTKLLLSSIFNKLFKKIYLWAIVVFLSIVFIQPLIYYIQTGSFFVWSYKTEDTNQSVGFNFLNPEFFNILFSYKKGFFVYTPIALISMFGLIPLFKQNKFSAFTIFLLLFLQVYILASWWCWWFGMSLGNRGFIDFLPVWIFLYLFLLEQQKKIFKIIFFSVGILCIIYMQILGYQYRYKIIYIEMDKQMFWEVFLKTNDKYKGLLENRVNPANRIFSIDTSKDSLLLHQLEKYDTLNLPNTTNEKYYSSGHSIFHTPENPYGEGYCLGFHNLSFTDTLIIQTSVMVYSDYDVLEDPFYLVFSIEDGQKSYNYNTLFSKSLIWQTGQWNRVIYENIFTINNPAKDYFKVYIWYTGKEKIYTDDFELKIFKKQH